MKDSDQIIAEDTSSVSTWLQHLKQGDHDAARKLWDRYFDELVRLARARLGTASRRVADEEDVAINAFKSLCYGAIEGQFPKLDDREDLWKLLVMITRQKAVDQIREQQAAKRGGGAVRGESVFVSSDGSELGGLQELLGDAPTPEFLTAIGEEHQRLLESLKNDTFRDIAIWKMEGYSNQEIAGMLGITVRSVERKIKLIREQWARRLDQQK